MEKLIERLTACKDEIVFVDQVLMTFTQAVCSVAVERR